MVQRFFVNMEHIPGVEALCHSAVEGVFSNEIQRPPAQGVDLVADENIPRADQGEEQLTVVVEVQPAHVPGLVVVQLQMEFHVCHVGYLLPLVETALLYHASSRYANFMLNYRLDQL